MKKCIHCQEEIEDKASICPHCNWNQPEHNLMDILIWAMAGLFAGLATAVFTFFFFSVLYPRLFDMSRFGNDYFFTLGLGCAPISLVTGIVGWVVVALILNNLEISRRVTYILTAICLILTVLLFWGLSIWGY